jgi:ABC-type multidrug transport system ATPase subunit
MRIKELYIDDQLGSKVGLGNSSMRKLESVVALIGKNGSGKTRVLSLLESTITEKSISKGQIDFLPQSYYERFNMSGNVKLSSDNENDELVEVFASSTEVIDHIKRRVVRIDPDKLMSIDINDESNVIDFSLLLNPNANIEDTYNNVELTKSAIAFLNSLSSRLLLSAFNAFRRNLNVEDLPHQQIFTRLKNIVKQMMGIDLDFDESPDQNLENIKGIITADNKPFNYNWLSPGQKILFSYCIYFFILDLNPKFNLKRSLIVIDEPEKHLHPEAQIQLIDGVRKIIEEQGQLWIATHSVHILSHLRPNEIFFVESGNVITPSSLTPAKALDALMGYFIDGTELAELLMSTSQWAFSKFIADCLQNPSVIGATSKNDPQFRQFIEALKGREFERVLDYGAGHGRLEKTLEETGKSNKFKIDVFEPNLKFKEELKQIKVVDQVFTDPVEIPANTYDLVILCNVLHEIEIKEWGTVFRSIKSVLKYNGHLILIEDLILPRGEAPNEIGYLVFGVDELMKLFSLYTSPIVIEPHEERYKERIMCAVIGRNNINVHKSAAIQALSALKERCLEKIKNIRTMQDSKSGRLLAFYNQQYINCELAIEYLTDYSKPNSF